MPESDFDSVEGIIRGLAVCINGAAAVTNIVPLTAILRTPRLLSINEVALNMSLIISDFCLSSMMTMAVATGWGNHGAFLDNRVVCQLQGIATQVFSVVSILTLLLISVNNYLVIVLEWQHLTRPQIAGCVVVLSKNLQLQIALVKRALSLVLVFLLSWGAYVIMLIVEYANGKPVTQLTEAVVFLFPSLNALLNPIVLVLMDRRYREAVHEMFGQNPKP
nr:hypothetical protein HK105_003832 [Polyrhizophydium stewartii]